MPHKKRMENCGPETPEKEVIDIVDKDTPEKVVEQNKQSDGGSRTKKKNILGESFPWYDEFKEMCSCSEYTTSIKGLVKLLKVYKGYITRDIATCHNKPSRACKIKQNLSRVLEFFNMRFKKLNLNFDEPDYMDLMSDLLAMYIEIGVQASRRGKESARIIAKKTTSFLFIMLQNSPDYIMDTMMKVQYIYRPRFKELFIPIFMKVIHLPPTSGLTYIRFLLIFKIWKLLDPDNEERSRLNKLAAASLKPTPLLLELIQRKKLYNVLPNLPILNENPAPSWMTRFYMIKKFDLRHAIEEFLKLTQWMKLYHLRPNLEAIENYPEGNHPPNTSIISVDDDKINDEENWNVENSSFYTDHYTQFASHEFMPRPLRPSNFDSSMNVISIDLTETLNKNSLQTQEPQRNNEVDNVPLYNMDHLVKKPSKKVNKKKKLSKKISQGSFQRDTEQFLKKLSIDDFQRNVNETSYELSNSQLSNESTMISQNTSLNNAQESNNNQQSPYFNQDCNYSTSNKQSNKHRTNPENRKTSRNLNSVHDKISKKLELCKAIEEIMNRKQHTDGSVMENNMNEVQNEHTVEEDITEGSRIPVVQCDRTKSGYSESLISSESNISSFKDNTKTSAEEACVLNKNKEDSSYVEPEIHAGVKFLSPSKVSVVDTSKLLEPNRLHMDIQNNSICNDDFKDETESLLEPPLVESHSLSHETFRQVIDSEKSSMRDNVTNVSGPFGISANEYESEESNLVIDEDVDSIKEPEHNENNFAEYNRTLGKDVTDQPTITDVNNVILNNSYLSRENSIVVRTHRCESSPEIPAANTNLSNSVKGVFCDVLPSKNSPTTNPKLQLSYDCALTTLGIQRHSQITFDNLTLPNERNVSLQLSPVNESNSHDAGIAEHHTNVVSQEAEVLEDVRPNDLTDSNLNHVLEKTFPDRNDSFQDIPEPPSQQVVKHVQSNRLVSHNQSSYDDTIPIIGPQPHNQLSCDNLTMIQEINVPQRYSPAMTINESNRPTVGSVVHHTNPKAPGTVTSSSAGPVEEITDHIPTTHSFSISSSPTITLNPIARHTPLEYHEPVETQPPTDMVPDELDGSIGYEFDFFPVAHEVEVCSVQDSAAGEGFFIIDNSTVPLQPHPSSPTPTSVDRYIQSNVHNSYELQQVSTDMPSDIRVECKPLHKKTLQIDLNMCGSQREFKQFYLYQKVAPTIPIPLPIQEMPEVCQRCLCEVCQKNHKVLNYNYSVLCYMQDAKLKHSGKRNSPGTSLDKDLNNDPDCSLPLKKRKAMTQSPPQEPVLYSYPNTPMMSIAQLQLSNTITSNNIVDWKSTKSCSEDPINLVQSKQTAQKPPKQTKRKTSKRRKTSSMTVRWFVYIDR